MGAIEEGCELQPAGAGVRTGDRIDPGHLANEVRGECLLRRPRRDDRYGCGYA